MSILLSEKLLLELLIILAPILVYSILLENKQMKHSPSLCGVLAGIVSSLCMIYTYKNYGMHWDLRYVPLILSFLYCGPLAGGIATSIALITRTLIGGNTLYIAYIVCFAAIIVPMIVCRNFWKRGQRQRIKLTVITGIWPLLMTFISLLISHHPRGFSIIHASSCIYNLFLFEFIHIVSIYISAKLIEDVYERLEMKSEIQKAEKLNTLSELAASIAHEVRNPLTVVKGFLQLMQQDEEGKNREYLSLVLNELGRAETIINDYLNFAKPKFEKIEEFQLRDALKDIILLLEPYALKYGVQLESELDITRFCLITDRNQLKQALVNLIKNAIEATDPGGCVSVKMHVFNGFANIHVSDNGKGMTKEQLSRIGTLFYTTKEKGTGLGTSVSLRIIETMNGKVSYSSEPGVGTVVTMVLPAGKKEISLST